MSENPIANDEVITDESSSIEPVTEANNKPAALPEFDADASPEDQFGRLSVMINKKYDDQNLELPASDIQELIEKMTGQSLEEEYPDVYKFLYDGGDKITVRKIHRLLEYGVMFSGKTKTVSGNSPETPRVGDGHVSDADNVVR